MFLSNVFNMLFLIFKLLRQYSSWSKITSNDASFYGILFYFKESFELYKNKSFNSN